MLSVLTKYPQVSDLLQSTPEVAPRLEAASVGVNVHMTDGLLDPDAETQGASREGVEDVHKVSVVGRQPPVGMHALKVWASRVQTCRSGRFDMPINRSHPENSEVIGKSSLGKLTGYPPDFICGVAAGKSRHMGAEAVANQMHVLCWSIGGFLQGTQRKEARLVHCFVF